MCNSDSGRTCVRLLPKASQPQLNRNQNETALETPADLVPVVFNSQPYSLMMKVPSQPDMDKLPGFVRHTCLKLNACHFLSAVWNGLLFANLHDYCKRKKKKERGPAVEQAEAIAKETKRGHCSCKWE